MDNPLILTNLLKKLLNHNNINLSILSLYSLYTLVHYGLNEIIPFTNTNNTIPEIQSNSPPEVQPNSFPLGVEPSSNYLSLKGNATPGDRGEEKEEEEQKVLTRKNVDVQPLRTGILHGGTKVVNPEEQTSTEVQPNSFPLGVEPSSNYLPVNGNATPGDRGEESETINGSRGEVNREATTASGMTTSTGPQVDPVADPREAEGEVNREGRLQDKDKTSNGEVTTLSGMTSGIMDSVLLNECNDLDIELMGMNNDTRVYFNRLYEMLNMDVLCSEYNKYFILLLDESLSSNMLQSSLIIIFIKKILRLSTMTDTIITNLLLIISYKLLINHINTSINIIHNNNIKSNNNFMIANEDIIGQSKFIYLWELLLLLNHINDDTRLITSSFFMDLTNKNIIKYNLNDFIILDHQKILNKYINNLNNDDNIFRKTIQTNTKLINNLFI